MKKLATLALAVMLLSPVVAYAGAATDAALGLGAFAVANQFVGGVGVFGQYAVPAPVYAAPAPVYAIPAPVYVAPRPVFYAPAPVVVVPRVIVRPIRPVFFAPPVVFAHHHHHPHFIHHHRHW
jgi:PXPV repeat-containing protein